MRKKARVFMKEKKWSDAIKCFFDALEMNKDQGDEYLYKNLGKCLRFEGDYHQALTILEEGMVRFPGSLPLYNELYFLFVDQNRWEDARSIAKKLIAIKPDEAKHYFKLGRCYNYLKKIDLAEQYFIKALEKKHNMALSDIILYVAKDIDPDLASIQSRYFFIGGKNNYGAIEHIQHGNKGSATYITKIVSASKTKEIVFYDKICKQYPKLQSITPKIISIKEFNGTNFITMEKIIGHRPDKNRAQDVLNSVLSKITSVRYSEELLNCFAPPLYRLALKKDRSQAVSLFFSSIHKESTNRRLFMLLDKKLSSANYSAASINILRHLEKIIMNFKLYEKIIPEKHYSFLHADLGPHNILLKNDLCPYVLDWNSYTIGLSCFDAAYFLSRYKFSFEEIEKLYLNNINIGKDLDNIENIFFIYALIVIWFQRFNRKDFDRAHLKYLDPAMDRLEVMAMQEIEPERRDEIAIQKITRQHKRPIYKCLIAYNSILMFLKRSEIRIFRKGFNRNNGSG